MAIRIVRLGSPRARGEGLRLGTVRRPPRGVRKADYARRNFYDLWIPELAPSAGLIAQAQKNWQKFARGYRREMRAPVAQRLLEREERCHRSILRELLDEHGARLA